MKKILAILMALLLMVGCLAACQPNKEPDETVGGDTTGASLADAVSYLQGLYKDAAEKTPMDYDVVGKILIGETVFTVEWSVDVDEVTVKKSEKDGFYTIDVPDVTTEEIPYVLTATVKDAAGKSQKKSFNRYVPIVDNSALVTNPEEGTAYKFFLEQASLGQTLYATGEISGTKYIASTTDASKALDFYVEKVEGGVKIYTEINGAKKYLHAHTEKGDDGKVSKYLGYADSTDCVWSYVADVNAWIVSIDKTEYVVGTYSTYNTFCISEKSYITAENTGVSQFPAGFITPDNAANKKPVGDVTEYKTAAEILKAAYALEKGKVLSGGKNYTLTGKIIEVNSPYDSGYGNITVTIVVDNLTKYPIECFRLKGKGADKIGKGDTITVTGQILKYDNGSDDGKVEFNSGCTLDSYKSSGNKVEEEVLTNAVLKPVTPETGKAYKMAFIQENVKKTAYFMTGKLNGFYAASTTVEKDGADYYIEKATGGYYLYAKVDGKKMYVNIVEAEGTDGKMHVNIKYETKKSTVYTYNTKLQTVVTKLGEDEYAPLGTDATKTYTTLGPRKTSGDNFYAKFVVKGTTTSEKKDEEEKPASLNAVTPTTGKAYNIAFINTNLSESDIYYLTGKKSSHYAASTKKVAEAANFYLETATGGYYMYAVVDGAKKYVNTVKNGTFINVEFQDTKSTVYTYNKTLKTVVTKVDNVEYAPLATSADAGALYTTLGPRKTSVNNFYGQFVVSTNKDSTDPSNPPAGGDDDDDNTGSDTTSPLNGVKPVVGTAYNIGVVNPNKSATDIYYLTGVLEGFYAASTTTVADAANFYIESVTGGYNMYAMVNGAKKYVNMVTSVSGDKTYVNVKFENTASTVYTYDETLKTMVSTVSGAEYAVLATNSSKDFVTLGPVKTEYDPFVGQFVVSTKSDSTTPSNPPAGDDDDDNTGDDTADDYLSEGTAYRIKLVQGKANKTVYVNGTMASTYYFGTTETEKDGIVFYVEKATGGYYLYTTIDGAKKYVNAVASGTHVNAKYQDTASTVCTYDKELKTLVTMVSGVEYALLGTRSDKTFTTLGPVKTSSDNFYADLVLPTEGTVGGNTGDGDGDENTGDGDGDDNTGNDGAAKWTLVTDVSTLAAGDKIIIVAKDFNYALGTNQKSNNRGAAAITKDGNTLGTPSTDVQVLTLEAGTTAGTFSFNTGSGYLYAASSSKNYLRTETSKTANSSWKITIAANGAATVVAQGSNTRATLQYNNGDAANLLFSCYSSASQKAVAIYKLA